MLSNKRSLLVRILVGVKAFVVCAGEIPSGSEQMRYTDQWRINESCLGFREGTSILQWIFMPELLATSESLFSSPMIPEAVVPRFYIPVAEDLPRLKCALPVPLPQNCGLKKEIAALKNQLCIAQDLLKKLQIGSKLLSCKYPNSVQKKAHLLTKDIYRMQGKLKELKQKQDNLKTEKS